MKYQVSNEVKLLKKIFVAFLMITSVALAEEGLKTDMEFTASLPSRLEEAHDPQLPSEDTVLASLKKFHSRMPQHCPVPSDRGYTVKYYTGVSHSFHWILVHGHVNHGVDEMVPPSDGKFYDKFYYDKEGLLHYVVNHPSKGDPYVTSHILYEEGKPFGRLAYSKEGQLMSGKYVYYHRGKPFLSCSVLWGGSVVNVKRIESESIQSEREKTQPKDSDNEVIAIVLGKEITLKDKDRLDDLICGALYEKFAKENQIEPTEEELDTFILKSEEMKKQTPIRLEKERKKLIEELKDPTLNEKKRKRKEQSIQSKENFLKSLREDFREEEGFSKELKEEIRPMMRESAKWWVGRWKVNKALYAKYGGRVIFQQGGPEPVDAYRDFLKEQEKNGAFKILDKQYEAPFWRYFINDAMHVFCSPGDEVKIMETPWWLMEKPLEK